MKQQLTPSKSCHSLKMSQINNNQQPFTFQSQQPSHQYSYIQINDRFDKQCRDDETDQSQYRHQMEKQCKMRIQSLTKSYQIKIARQQQTFQLKQLKYMEQIQYLKRQLKQFFNLNKDQKQKAIDSHCSICSNGDVLTFMKNMLQALQKDHSGCIGEKTILTTKNIGLEQKVQILEAQMDETEQRYQKIKQQNKQLRLEKQVWDREKRQKQRQFRQVERQYQTKQLAFQQQVIKQKITQKQLQNQIKKIQQKHIEDVLRLRQQPIQPFIAPPPMPIIKQTIDFSQSRRSRHYQDRCSSKQPKIYKQNTKRQEDHSLQHIHEPSINIDHQQLYLPRRHQKQQKQQRYRLVDPLQQPRKPLRSSSTFNSVSNTHMAPTWKTKMKQSYTDYANSKRRDKKPQNKNMFFSTMQENFDTFRPSTGQQGPRNTAPAPIRSSSTLMKYGYLS